MTARRRRPARRAHPRRRRAHAEPTLSDRPASSGAPREADLRGVRTVPIVQRPAKVRAMEFARPPGDDGAATIGDFLDSLPDILVARDFRAVVAAIVAAHRAGRAVLVMLGGHVVKTGLTPLLIDLLERRVVTQVAMNGSAAIHDYEMARFGATSEDVAAGIRDGTFGMAEETGRGMNEAFVDGAARARGMGEAIACALSATPGLAHPELSLLLAAHRLGAPVTVHAAIGAEVIHQHPAANGAAIGETSHRDFRRLAAGLSGLDDGGVVLNIGSAVIMPEVFLKALTVARNLDHGRPTRFVTCDFDMQRHYRPRVNVVERPTQGGGRGYEITGHHEIMVPLLAWAVVDALGRREEPGGA